MEPRLIPINVWIALHRGEAGWPRNLADQGFAIHRLEAPVSTSAGLTVVDGISVRGEPATVLVTECKAGGSVENEQARRYAAMTPQDVYRFVGLPSKPDLWEIEPIYACLGEGRGGIRVDLDRLGLPFPLLVVDDRRVRLEAAAEDAVDSFSVKVPPGPPPRYVVVDGDSSEEELLEYLLPELMAAASRGQAFVRVDTLLQSVMPYWDVYGPPAKKQLRTKARAALVRAIENKFPNDFAFENTGQTQSLDRDIIRIISTPVRLDSRGRTQAWQRLQRGAAKVVGRAPTRPPAPGQQIMFEDLGLGSEVGDD